jgi:5-methylcytosine-specific restriction endonuclease McrA
MVKIREVNKKKRPKLPPSVLKQVLARAKGRCGSCGINVKEIQYHIHHKDGNHYNNELSNLAVLCTKCHAENLTRDEIFKDIY